MSSDIDLCEAFIASLPLKANTLHYLPRKREIDELVMDAVEKRPKVEAEKEEKPAKTEKDEDAEMPKKASPKKKAVKSDDCKCSFKTEFFPNSISIPM